MTLVRLLARPALSSIFVVGGINAFRNADAMSSKAEPVTEKIVPLAKRVAPQVRIPDDSATLIKANGALQVVAGLLLATGKLPRLSANVLALSMVPTTAAGHRFWEESDPHVKANQKVHFFKNVSIIGGLLLGGVDTEGRPGLAWRVQHTAAAAKREAKHARRAAKREGQLGVQSARAGVPFL
jgi:uncharacterized membrane protein YphA (DoxX/SURF4 family)